MADKGMRRLRRLAVRAGWVSNGVRGSGHYRLTWPPTGQYVTMASSPACPYAHKHARKDMEQISGDLDVLARTRRHR